MLRFVVDDTYHRNMQLAKEQRIRDYNMSRQIEHIKCTPSSNGISNERAERVLKVFFVNKKMRKKQYTNKLNSMSTYVGFKSLTFNSHQCESPRIVIWEENRMPVDLNFLTSSLVMLILNKG